MSKINDRIKQMRRSKGLTLLEVAEYVGVKEATAQRYESGNIKTIKYDIICKLAELFQCDPSYLMGWSDSINSNNITKSTITNSSIVQGSNTSTVIIKSNGIQEREISNQAVELLRIFESLGVKEQAKLLIFAFDLEEKAKNNSNIVDAKDKTSTI